MTGRVDGRMSVWVSGWVCRGEGETAGRGGERVVAEERRGEGERGALVSNDRRKKEEEKKDERVQDPLSTSNFLSTRWGASNFSSNFSSIRYGVRQRRFGTTLVLASADAVA